MRKARLDEMTRGWFVGDFSPTVHKTDAVEVAVKSYKAGDKETRHYHKIATEITLILEGTVELNGEQFGPGDIFVLEPYERASFAAVTDAVNVVVKTPGASDDKYVDPE